jgi:hypothetical protein
MILCIDVCRFDEKIDRYNLFLDKILPHAWSTVVVIIIVVRKLKFLLVISFLTTSVVTHILGLHHCFQGQVGVGCNTFLDSFLIEYVSESFFSPSLEFFTVSLSVVVHLNHQFIESLLGRVVPSTLRTHLQYSCIFRNLFAARIC